MNVLGSVVTKNFPPSVSACHSDHEYPQSQHFQPRLVRNRANRHNIRLVNKVNGDNTIPMTNRPQPTPVVRFHLFQLLDPHFWQPDALRVAGSATDVVAGGAPNGCPHFGQAVAASLHSFSQFGQ